MNRPPQSKRVAIYARRSDESGDRDRSIKDQVGACKRWAEERGYSVVKIYDELGSGVNGADRAIFVGMIEDAERKPRLFEVVVVLDVSRFGRADVDETGYWRHRLRVAGVEVAYVLDGDKLSGETGQLVGSVLQVAARDHSVRTGYKVALAHGALVERGLWPGGRAPYGYRTAKRPDWDGNGPRESRLVVDEDLATVVRRIFGAYESGRTPPAMAGDLNREGVPSPKGKAWRACTIIGILSNPAYVGDLVMNVKRRRHPVPKPKFYRSGPRGPVVASDLGRPIVKRDAWPPIVTRQQFDRVQKRIEERAIQLPGGKPWPLTGLAKCAVCNRTMKGMGGRTTRGKRYTYYHCSGAADLGHCGVSLEDRGECLRTTIRSDRLEEAVVAAVRSEIARTTHERLASDIRRALPKSPVADVSAIERRRRTLATRRDALLLSEGANGEFLRAGLDKLEEEDDRLSREIEEAKAARASHVDVDEVATKVLEAARGLEAPNNDEGCETLRRALRLFVRDIHVSAAPRRAPKRVKLEINLPKAVPFLPSSAMLWKLAHR